MQYLIFFTHRSGSSYLRDLLKTAGLGPLHEFLATDNVKDYSHCKGFKVAWDAYNVLASQCQIPEKLIYLTRRDKVRQAISFYRALMSDQWSSWDDQKRTPVFNREGILEQKRIIEHHESEWEKLLKDKPHLRLTYEELGTDAVYRIGEFLGQPVKGQPESALKVQRDEMTEQWVQMLGEA